MKVLTGFWVLKVLKVLKGFLILLLGGFLKIGQAIQNNQNNQNNRNPEPKTMQIKVFHWVTWFAAFGCKPASYLLVGSIFSLWTGVIPTGRGATPIAATPAHMAGPPLTARFHTPVGALGPKAPKQVARRGRAATSLRRGKFVRI